MFLQLGRTQKINISLLKTLIGQLYYKNRSCEMALKITSL